jgi:hypothetical protein
MIAQGAALWRSPKFFAAVSGFLAQKRKHKNLFTFSVICIKIEARRFGRNGQRKEIYYEGFYTMRI